MNLLRSLWSRLTSADRLDFAPGGFCRLGTRFLALGARRQAVFCFDENGATVWHRALDHAVETVTVSPSGEYVLLATAGNNVLFLGPNGDTLWQRHQEDVRRAAPTYKWMPHETEWMPVVFSVGIDEPSRRVYLPDEEGRPSAVDFGGNPCWTADRDIVALSMACSDDGSRIFSTGAGYVACFDASGRALWVTETPHSQAAYRAVPSPDGTKVACLAGTWETPRVLLGVAEERSLTYLFLLDADGHVLAEEMTFYPKTGREWTFSGSAEISSAGRTVAFSMRGREAKVLRAGYPATDIAVWAPWALSQDGRFLAGTDCNVYRVYCFDMSSPPSSKRVLNEGLRKRPVLVHVGEDQSLRVVLYDAGRQWVGVTEFALP